MKAKNPSGKTCEFNKADHYSFTILETGQKLRSVSKIQRGLFPEFDSEGIAAKCLKKPEYSGMLPNEIVALWGMEADRSRENGSNTHDMISAYIKEEPMPGPISMSSVRMFKCAVNHLKLLSKNYEIIGSEVLVFSESLDAAGFIDLVLRRKNSVLIVDWKTNREMRYENRWQKALSPIKNLDACNLNEYMIQANILRKILLHENYFPGCTIRAELAHLNESGNTTRIPVKIMNNEMNKIFKT